MSVVAGSQEREVFPEDVVVSLGQACLWVRREKAETDP